MNTLTYTPTQDELAALVQKLPPSTRDLKTCAANLADLIRAGHLPSGLPIHLDDTGTVYEGAELVLAMHMASPIPCTFVLVSPGWSSTPTVSLPMQAGPQKGSRKSVDETIRLALTRAGLNVPGNDVCHLRVLAGRIAVNGLHLPDYQNLGAKARVQPARRLSSADCTFMLDPLHGRNILDRMIVACFVRRLIKPIGGQAGLQPAMPGHIVWTAFAGGKDAQDWMRATACRSYHHPLPIQPLLDVLDDMRAEMRSNLNNYERQTAKVANAFLTAQRMAYGWSRSP